MNKSVEERKGLMTQKRIEVLRTWLNEDGSAESGGADLRNISIKSISKEDAEKLGKVLIKEVVKTNGDVDNIEELIRAGADVNFRDDQNLTPLMQASMCGHKEIVEVLISNGAGIDLKCNSGWTALMWASVSSNRKVVDVLINNGADVSLTDKNGKTAADYAGNEKIKELIEEAENRQ